MKYLKIIIPAALIFVFALFYFIEGNDSRISVEEGIVELWADSSWQTIEGEVKISEGSKIRTLAGKATLLLENQITQLNENTEVEISELSDKQVTLKTQGSTWTKVLKVIKGQNVRIEHPTVVAMVRGTEFGTNEQGLLVAEGRVIGLLDGSEYNVTSLQLLLSNGTIIPADPALIKERVGEMLALLEKERAFELDKRPVKVQTALVMGPWESREEALADLDRGTWSREEIEGHTAYGLFKKDFARALQLTWLIIEQRQLLESL